MTSNDLKSPKPVTELNWAGEPMRPEEAYGGKPEHWPITEITKRARRGIKAMTDQRLAQLREGMRKAREAKLARLNKARNENKPKAGKTKGDSLQSGTDTGKKAPSAPITTKMLVEVKATPYSRS